MEILPDLSIYEYNIDTSEIDKMKIVGKLGDEPTILDTNSIFGQIAYTYSIIYL